MRVMKMLAYRYARAVHDIGVESGGDDDDGGDDGWIDRSRERAFTLAFMLMRQIMAVRIVFGGTCDHFELGLRGGTRRQPSSW